MASGHARTAALPQTNAELVEAAFLDDGVSMSSLEFRELVNLPGLRWLQSLLPCRILRQGCKNFAECAQVLAEQTSV